MILTERDIQLFRFIAKWRVVTCEQIRKAKIFTATSLSRRLRILKNNQYLKTAKTSNRGKYYYYLTMKAAEAADIDFSWQSSMFCPAQGKVVKYLIALDFALAMGLEKYLDRDDTLNRLGLEHKKAQGIIRMTDLFYEKDGQLYLLIIDNRLSFKYFQERVKGFLKLPAGVKEKVNVTVLVFSEPKKKLVKELFGGKNIEVKIFKALWKY